ncbi:DNA repair protein XRCC4 isoform X2 [Denticeps clupeoides]|uniref:Uncharacterized protein n=1 Tax=Denticeps clupeoides TaxID=299321 RepID=A0AAY4BI56_9TELE|nr:DNA repair protein XRCC4 isoform X2 [Denticeps clupeoides]XP_028829797.1 DNA repair protein XRCC4 isoform X2 [Denticeps clupeoides]XP_028829798.1 DNA repair protein XRCC4 isoform X2 [Denticeps clupeoides]
MDVSVRQISIASEPKCGFFLKIEWKKDLGAGFVTVLCDGSSAWTGEVSEDEVTREAQDMEMQRERYVDELQLALTGVGSAAQDYSFHLDGPRSGGKILHLSYEKVQKDISFKLGAVELQPVPDPTEVIGELISEGLEQSARLLSSNRHLQEENRRLRQEQEHISAEMERYAQGKETLEMELYRRFVLVLNEKKAKIRTLQEKVKQLEDALEDEVQSKKTSKPESLLRGAGSPGKSRHKDESDYEASTEEEGEEDHQPKVSLFKNKMQDTAECSPIDDNLNDITDVAPCRKRRHRHLQQLESQAKRAATERQQKLRGGPTKAKAEPKKDAAQHPAVVPKANPEPEDLYDDI